MASWMSASLLGLFLLSALNNFVRGEKSTAPTKLVKYQGSYLVRYQKATCEGPDGELIFLGPDDPIVLAGTGNLQVLTAAVRSGPKLSEQIWNQTLIEKPSTYTIQQSGNSDNCMMKDADTNPGDILPLDYCQSPYFYTPQRFIYKLVRNNLPGCKRSNRNGWAVMISSKAAFDIGKNVCFSAPKTPGVHATVETCNPKDESQLFFINVPSIRRRLCRS